MHISEGFLSPQMLAAGWVITGAGTAVGLKKLDPDKIVRVAVFSSVFFLSSLIYIPIGPSSTHLSLIGPIGLLLGWSAFPGVLVALLLQAMLLRFGGFVVLGANTATIALPALIVYLLFSAPIRRSSAKTAAVLSFAAGFVAVALCVAGIIFFLVLSDARFLNTAKVLASAHVFLALIEGAVTLFMVGFLRKTAPDILDGVSVAKHQGEPV
jgi:cobalt/nickel transport system permease protein